MGSKLADGLAYPPRIFRSDRAAAYLSTEGRLPKGKKLGGITFWDRAMLDSFVDNYQGEEVAEDKWAKILGDTK
jgi:hypothetical protein